MVQWLRHLVSAAGDTGSVPSGETRSNMLQLRPGTVKKVKNKNKY